MESTRIEDLITYNPETGEFKWLDTFGKQHKDWFTPGTSRPRREYSYVRRSPITVDGKAYAAHRLAWYLMKGYWPKIIDHINRDPLDNRFSNLREVTRKENQQNIKGLGYSKYGNRYVARIVIDNKTKYLGTFNTAEEATSAYLSAKKEYHKGFIDDAEV